MKIINGEDKEEDILNKIKLNNQANITLKNDILVEGIGDIKVNLASCCKAVPGDNIIGYITRGNGISIHRSNCQHILDTDERIINVKWNYVINKKYPTDVIIYTKDDDNLVDLVTKASSNNVQIQNISAYNSGNDKIYTITVLVASLENLNKFMNDINNLKFVKSVERMMS